MEWASGLIILTEDSFDHRSILRKQMQEAENQERQKTLEESIQKQAEMDKRIKSRVVAQNPEEVIAAQVHFHVSYASTSF